MEQTEYPLVSAVLLAGRVSTADVHAAIKCFRSQTYPYKELIVVNNCKTQLDATSLNLTAERGVFLIDTPLECSAGMARNYGISAANGQIIAQFDADYWHAPNRLEAQIATLADQAANMVVLTSTLQYSYISGRAGIASNDRNIILNSMVFMRPQGIDYPNLEKQEELGLLNKFQDAESKIISMQAQSLMCKLILTSQERNQIPTNNGLDKAEFKLLKKLVKERQVL